MRAILRSLLLNSLLLAGSLLVALFIAEAALALVLSHPAILALENPLSQRALKFMRQYYMDIDRAIVQLEPECFRYDAELTYTLKQQSTCRVTNREHEVQYQSNSQGLRDSESALNRPRIVVVGDSHAMGWGVGAAQSFPKLLETELKVSVLNAAMSSYGTARELALLERLRLAEFPVLLIQYCDNDFLENKFLVDKGKLEITPEPQFRAFSESVVKRRRYRNFKHTKELVKMASAAWRSPKKAAENQTDNDEARYFIEVLLHHEKLLAGKTVFVIELNGNNLNNTYFISALSGLLHEPRYSGLKDSVVPLDVSKALTASDYYVLDDHMKPEGHAKVAALVAAELAQRGLLAKP